MSRRDRELIAFAVVAALVSTAFWALWIVTAASSALVLTLILHGIAATLTAVLVPRRGRSLAIALALTVPVLGPLAAALSTIVAGRAGQELLHDPHAVELRISGIEIARRLTQSLPACEALMSADIEVRRQALAKLKGRAASEDISTLRWARTQRRGDAAVEVALAFEEISARFEQQATIGRAAVRAAPTFESLSALFLVLATGITTGVVDSALVGRVAAEACRHHDAALAADPRRGRDLLAARARLELAVNRPAEALALLRARPLDLKNHRDLAQLYFEAAYAARRFDLVPRTSNAAA